MKLFNFDREPRVELTRDAPPPTGLRLVLSTVYRELFPLLGLTLLLVVTSLPVVTMPAARCAAGRIAAHMVRDEPYFLWHDFWRIFRREFRRVTPLGLLCLLVVGLGGLACVCYILLPAEATVTAAAAAVSGLGAVVGWGYYASLVTMVGLVDLPLGSLARNALLLLPGTLPRALPALAVNLLLLGAALLAMPYSLALFLFVPGLGCLLTTFAVYGPIRQHVLCEEG